MHLFWIGVVLGLGVAIPLGPINVEMIRRNITFGTRYGVAVGVGATSADTTYIILILAGILVFLTKPLVLELVGVLGAIVLLWFAYKTLSTLPKEDHHQLKKRSVWHTYLAGYLMTLLSPFTILFWASIGTQIAAITHGAADSIYLSTFGVICGTLAWSLSLNTVLHFTRHKISLKVMRILNVIGGLILIAFAIGGLAHTIEMILHH